jgi:hypothetical protein
MGLFRPGLFLFTALWYLIAAAPFAQADAAPIAKGTPSGDGIELEYATADGTIATTVLPSSRVGAIR